MTRCIEKSVSVVRVSEVIKACIGLEGVELWYTGENFCEAIRSDRGAIFPMVEMRIDKKKGLFYVPYEKEVIIIQDHDFLS